MKETSGQSYIKRNLPLLIIVGLLASVLLAGFLFIPRDEAGKRRLLESLGTSNQGELLKPMVAIEQLELRNGAGETWLFKDQPIKWRLIIPVASSCNKACREALYLTRQVHVRLDKKSTRVERILLNLDQALDAETQNLIDREHRYLKILDGSKDAFAQLLVDTNADWQTAQTQVFIVDQNGYAMMYYTSEHNGADMLSDLRHLLKYSPES